MSEEKKPVQKRSGLYTFLRAAAAVLFHTIGPVKYTGKENIPQGDAPYIVICNHKSFFDPVLVAACIKKREVTFMGKKELASSKLTAAIFRNLHMIVVDRHNSDMAAMRACMKTLRDGGILGIFPEGTRHQPGTMEVIEEGAALIALRSAVPVVPFLITPKYGLLHRTHCIIGKPIPTEDIRAQGVNKETCAQLMDRMRSTYAEMLSAHAAKKNAH